KRKAPNLTSGVGIQRKKDSPRRSKHQPALCRQKAAIFPSRGRRIVLPFPLSAGGVERTDDTNRGLCLDPAATVVKPTLSAHHSIGREFRVDRTTLGCGDEYQTPLWVEGWVLPVRSTIHSRLNAASGTRYLGNVREDWPSGKSETTCPVELNERHSSQKLS